MAASAQSEPGRACGVQASHGRACRAAVLRAFSGMIDCGASYDSALSAAVRVFRHHHPEIETGVQELVEHWISPEIVH